MKAWIISIGDELLLGQIINTNAAFLAQKLTALGFSVEKILTIPDNHKHIRDTLQFALGKADLVVATGGLGPTSDDITKQVLADFFGGEMIINQEVLEDVKRFLDLRGLQMNDLQREQALVPSSATVIRNPYGTAPGLLFTKSGTTFVFMPGVPFEMQQMFEEKLEKVLRQRFDLPQIVMQFVHTYGLAEADLAKKLHDFEQSLPSGMRIAYLPSPEDIKIRLWMQTRETTLAKSVIEEQIMKITKILGKNVWAIGSDITMQEFVQELFIRKKQTLSTAESCTGGNIAHMITSVPGSSNYYKGTVVSYANEIKANLLGVSQADLDSFGAVSEPVVKQMAMGVKAKLDTDFSVATSGIAGPSGGTPEKPVGTVWIAVATPQGVSATLHKFGPRRDINIRRSSAMALFQLIVKFRENFNISLVVD